MEQQTKTLKELQASIKAVDAERNNSELTAAEREVLELAAVALRDAERVALATIQKQLIKDMEEQTKSLTEQARVIRARVTAINKPPKTIDKIESVIKQAVKLVAAVAKW